MPRAKTGKKSIRTQERQAQSLELRKAGLTLEEIGRKIGISKQAVHKHLVAAMEQQRRDNIESTSELIEMEVARLDTMMAGVWAKAANGDEKAIATVLKIQERKAKMLGLDAPEKSLNINAEVGITDQFADEFEAKILKPQGGGKNGV